MRATWQCIEGALHTAKDQGLDLKVVAVRFRQFSQQSTGGSPPLVAGPLYRWAE